MNIEDIIKNLQIYWSEQGCVVLQPLDVQVGAGTFHHATFLRAVDPNPWKAVHVQPSRRPTDGRYGKHPNRLQHYFQMQVVIKPSPENFQQLYLDSLTTLGIDAAKHDIRFVEDDWESPTLGAWGLGWEVWLDGMEITQFTFFQEVGGIRCMPVMGEITYGIERLAMHLQNRDDVYKLDWSDNLTYGELYQLAEHEQSTYNFEHANIDNLKTIFDDAESEGCDLAEKHLVIPAYEKMLVCSHTFNMLDARDAISVTEREVYVNRVRKLAKLVVKKHYEQITASSELQPTQTINPDL